MFYGFINSFSIVHKLGIPMNEAQEFFSELFFGSGAFLGLGMILIFVIIALAFNKWSGAFFIPFAIFMALFYFENIPENSYLMWNGIIMLCTIPFQLLNLGRKGD